ncbi:MAG: hypothetical protein ACP5QR_17670 [Rhizomicrobium sp.]
MAQIMAMRRPVDVSRRGPGGGEVVEGAAMLNRKKELMLISQMMAPGEG